MLSVVSLGIGIIRSSTDELFNFLLKIVLHHHCTSVDLFVILDKVIIVICTTHKFKLDLTD